MLSIDAIPNMTGLIITVRATCSGQAHDGTHCPARAITCHVPTDRIEALGFSIALEETLGDLWVEWPYLIEMVAH